MSNPADTHSAAAQNVRVSAVPPNAGAAADPATAFPRVHAIATGRKAGAALHAALRGRYHWAVIWGLALGGVTLTIAVGIAAATGATHFTLKTGSLATLLQAFLLLFLFFLIAAANEEALVRGFAFQALEHNLGAAVAISITSMIFGVLHLGNDDVTLFSTCNTVLAGIWLGVAYLMTRSLWLATALHFSWNFVMAVVFGLPVSGIKLFKTFAWLDGESTGQWISGADYGPEGGAAATLALLLCTLFIWKSGLFQTTQEMRQAIGHGRRQEDGLRITTEATDTQHL